MQRHYHRSLITKNVHKETRPLQTRVEGLGLLRGESSNYRV